MLPVADSSGLLKWLGKDRALVAFADLQSVKTNQKAFTAIIRQWLKHV